MTGFSTSRRFSKSYFVLVVLILAFVSQACGPKTSVAKESLAANPTATESVAQNETTLVKDSASNLPAPTIEAKDTPASKASIVTVNATSTPAAAVVTVTAVNGNLSIRSGPDISFDAIAILKDGETATAISRSIMDGWVEVPVPSQEGKTGWVLLKTNYFIVTGNVLDLPRKDLVEWNVGSYLINCTPHRMIVQPGDVILESVNDVPNNRVWFSPGLYSVYDLDVMGQPVAANLNVTEHREFHIIKDGDRTQWTCPSNTK